MLHAGLLVQLIVGHYTSVTYFSIESDVLVPALCAGDWHDCPANTRA